MKYKWDKKYLYWGMTAFLVLVAYVIFNSLIANISSVSEFFGGLLTVLRPVILGFAFAYVLTPVMNFYEKVCFRRLIKRVYSKLDAQKLAKNPGVQLENHRISVTRLSRGFGVFATMLSVVLLVAALVWAVIPELVVSFQKILGLDYIAKMRGWADSLLGDYPEFHAVAVEYIDNFSQTLAKFLNVYIMPQISDILTNISSGIVATVTTVFNFVIGIIICIYLLNSKELFAAQGKKTLYSLMTVKSANVIIRNLRMVHKKFGGFLVGKIIDSLIIGIIFFIILTIIDTPYVILISVILGITNIIPVFGPFIGAVPCGLLILFNSPVQSLYFIIVVVIVQQFDGNVLGPKILGDNTGLSSFWVIFALLIGQHFLGVVGLIVGIPIFAVFYSLFRNLVNRKLKHKEMPVDTNYYRELGYFNPDSGEAVALSTMRKAEQDELARLQAMKKRSRKESIVSKHIRELRGKKNKK